MEVELKFEPSGREGIVPVGTYLIDAALRLGIKIDDECGRKGECDTCAVRITKGAGLLSEPTKAELEHLSPERRKKGERLSCQAKIEKTGEITVMTTEKQKPEVPPFDAFKKEFAELPLEEKVKKLVDLEAITLSDTFNFVLNLPYYIGEKIRDGVAEFGFMKEEAEKQAKRPTEHTSTSETTEEKVGENAENTKEAIPNSEAGKKRASRKKTKPTESNETSA